jgi:hypothetical protein
VSGRRSRKPQTSRQRKESEEFSSILSSFPKPDACSASRDAEQEHFLLAYHVYLFTMSARRQTMVMRNIMFWLLMLVLFLALAGC